MQNNLSFTTMGTPEWTARQSIEGASRYGFGGIDLRVSDFKGEVQLESSDSVIKEIAIILKGEQVELAGLLCYNEVGDEDKASWKKMEESILRHMELGLKLCSPAIRIFAGNPHEQKSYKDYMARTADVLSSVLDATDSGIGIVIQNHQGSYKALECVELIKAVDNHRFGIVFSQDHSYMTGEDLATVYSAVKPYTKQFFISDVIRADKNQQDREFSAILPGKGVLDIKETYEALGGDDFKGFISFKWEKIWQDHLEGPEESLPYFIDYWKGLNK